MNLNNTVLGIELGSTRIKACLLDDRHMPLASGAYQWEAHLENGIWTYSMDEVHSGLRSCYAALKDEVKEKYGLELTTVGAIGISGMMHGYLPFDSNGRQLTGFRTWQNLCTAEASKKLTDLFDFNVPQRWSIAHLYQAILNGESHLTSLDHINTLAGYIHWKLCGDKLIGIGEASGMFPIDSLSLDYDETMVQAFDALIAPYGFGWKIRDLLPKVLCAGDFAGTLSEEGARFLDPSGTLQPGIPLAPCEGDQGTGMVATNSVAVGTGNVSAGTAINALVVTEHALGVHKEIDMVTTPAGAPVAMVHCNNCTSDINAWMDIFRQFARLIDAPVDNDRLYELLFKQAFAGDKDCGGLVSVNYFTGEVITGLAEGRPLFVRKPDADFSLANFMRSHLMAALATLRIGLDILTGQENVKIESLCGHGGYFKTPVVGQTLLSAATGVPVTTMETAGEGGPYGMALLCAYMLWHDENEALEEYLENKVFSNACISSLMANKEDLEGAEKFIEQYKNALEVENVAVSVI